MNHRAKFFLILVSCLTILSTTLYAQNTHQVTFEEINLDDYCFPFHFYVHVPQFERNKGKKYVDSELVINTEADYTALLKVRRGSANQVCTNDGNSYSDQACKEEKKCLNFNLPPIDFSKKTLLAKAMQGSCGATGFQKEIVQDDVKKEIIYSLKTIERAIACSGPGLHSMNFITVPKIASDYKVIFKPDFNEEKKGFQSYTYENNKTVARDWDGNIVDPRKTPPAGGGVFDVQISTGADMFKGISMEEKKLMITTGASNVPPPCPDGTTLEGDYCKKN